MKTNWIKIDSSLVEEVKYNAANNELLVKFKDKKVQKYFGVSDKEFNALVTPDMDGVYFSTNINPSHASVVLVH